MKYNKLIIILSSFFLSCAVAYMIGQNVVLPLTQQNGTEIDNENVVRQIEFDFVENFDQLTFEGKREVSKDDNPWGSTVAKIEDDTMGTSIMMVQGTGMSTEYHVDGIESIRWRYNIHPWVTELSDGMSLYVRVYADGDFENPRIRRSYSVSPDMDYSEMELSLEEFQNQNIKIEFATDNGGYGDDAGDWLILNGLNIVSTGKEEVPQKDNEDVYWISAHYFADASLMNLWDSEFENIDEDFEKIKSDGFNSIILLIPWGQFQPGIGKSNLYNQDALEKLDRVMEKADEHGIGVVLRIGYTWDYYRNRGNDEIMERYEKIVYDEQTREAWLEYVERLYTVAGSHQSLWGGFICWEDFWIFTEKMSAISGKNEDSLKYAQDIGFGDFFMNHYELSEIRKLYDDTRLYAEEDLYIPAVDKPAFKVFYSFYDDFLNHLLQDTQTAFPNVSMEVRIDDDWIVNEEGKNVYYSHAATYACDGSDYSTIMYGIPIGMKNMGEKVTWSHALEKTEAAFQKVAVNNGGKKIYVDQFLYYDNTQAYSHNAQLIDDQIDDYLLNVEDAFKEYTRGYGVWAYKDYYMDKISNGSFSDSLEGWETTGEAAVKEIDGKHKCLLVDGAEIRQDVSGKISDTSGNIVCQLDASLIDEPFVIKVSLNDETKQISVTKDATYSVEFDGDEWGKLSLSIDGEGFVDHVKLYNFCYNGLLYDADGNEGAALEAMRELNREMGKN